MGFNKKNDDILTEAFSKALEEEIAEIPNVGDEHEFSPEFNDNMEKLVKKSHTINFKLTSHKSQRYIAAAIAAVFIISTFTVAAKIAPPKVSKPESNSSESNGEDNVSSKKEDTSAETSTTDGNSVSHEKENISNEQSTSKETSSIESIQPWNGEDNEEISSRIYAEGFISTFESVFEAESDTDYVFHSNDRLYHRWNDLVLCGFVDDATDFSVKIGSSEYSYLAVPLSDYPYSDAILRLKGNPLSIITEHLDDCTVYDINYREDMQYLIIETESQSYLARYLKSENETGFSQMLEQVFRVADHTSVSHTAILDMSGKTVGKHSLTTSETETLFSILSKATIRERTEEIGKTITKIIITSEQGGTIHLFYHADSQLTLVDPKLGNHITLSKEDDKSLKNLLGLEDEVTENTASIISSHPNSSEIEAATSSLSSDSHSDAPKTTSEPQSSLPDESGVISATSSLPQN